DPPSAFAQEFSCRDLAARVDGLQIGGEPPDHRQTLEVAQLARSGPDCPCPRRLHGDRFQPNPVEIVRKVGQRTVLARQHVTERAAKAKVVLHCTPKRRLTHRSPPDPEWRAPPPRTDRRPRRSRTWPDRRGGAVEPLLPSGLRRAGSRSPRCAAA